MTRLLPALVVLVLIVAGVPAAAQSAPSPSSPLRSAAVEAVSSERLSAAQGPARRDPVWNGALIGLGVGVGTAAALAAIFCDAEGGRCDTPWAAYLTLGGVGAAAGASIDLLIGREAGRRGTTVRVVPFAGRAARGMLASVRF